MEVRPSLKNLSWIAEQRLSDVVIVTIECARRKIWALGRFETSSAVPVILVVVQSRRGKN